MSSKSHTWKKTWD